MASPSTNIYDYPKYYDLVYGSDWKAELDFLLACIEEQVDRPATRVFEPACGTGRLLFRLGKAGFAVSGLDLNARAISYCNARLKRHGLEPTAMVGDMTDFRLRRRVDVAFNMINSFRHLTTETQARAHLECVAAALSPGGIYVLGLHLTPTQGTPLESESWSARRGQLAVLSRLKTLKRDLSAAETVGMSFDVYTPTRQFRLADSFTFRTYTARQMTDLIRKVPKLRVKATYDFAYDLTRPIQVDRRTEDVVYLLERI